MNYERIIKLINPEHFKNINIIAIGCGSGNSNVLAELAKNGATNFRLFDHDTLDSSNLVRHILGHIALGKNKAVAMKEWLVDRNPHANVVAHECKFEDKLPILLDLLSSNQSNLILCGVDNHPARRELNQLCIETKTPYVMGMVFDQGAWGMSFRYTPGTNGGCFSCCESFTSKNSLRLDIAEMSDSGHSDDEIYGLGLDRFEKNPGLSIDIGFISLIMSRFALDAMLDLANSKCQNRVPLKANLISFCNVPNQKNGFKKSFEVQHLFLSKQEQCHICNNK